MRISTNCFVWSVAFVMLGLCYMAYLANNALHDWLIYQPAKQRVYETRQWTAPDEDKVI